MIDPELLQVHLRHNQGTQDAWNFYESHRARLLELLRKTSSDGDQNHRAAVLGSGNCNDLDLVWFRERFDDVHLVELDEASTRQGCIRQGVDPDEITIHGGFDVAAPLMSGELSSSIAQGSPVAIDRCDLVLSAGLFSQLALTVHQLIRKCTFDGETRESLQWVVEGHIKTVASMLRPDGIAIFAFDFVSSDSAPELTKWSSESASDEQLNDLAIELLSSGNFFEGLHPGKLIETIDNTNELRCIDRTAPWIWSVGLRRYLVAAVIVQRTG